MKRYLIIPAILLVFAACKEHRPADKHAAVTDTGHSILPIPEDSAAAGDEATDTTEEEQQTSTFYVVMTDTGMNYYPLHDKMMQLSTATGLSIDTMDRGYNAKKNLICLPESDADEIYAGEYYPRRFPSVNLSLEYLYMYMDDRYEEDKTIALVAGIFETRQSADSLLQVIQPYSKTSFVSKADIYTGCMH